MTDSPEEELTAALVKAKRAGYAGTDDDESIPNPLLPHSKELGWEEEPWTYRDIYFGMTQFTGLETLSHDQQPVWAMAYSGGLTRPSNSAAYLDLFAFLRGALMLMPVDLPLRGPARHEIGNRVYTMRCEGTVNRFSGTEVISQSGQVLYSARFAGGLIL